VVGKYKRDTTEGAVIAKVTNSHLWKSIVKLWPYIDAHSWWIIGDGKSIDFCHDAWIEEGLRLENCNLRIPVHLRNNKLIDIVDNEG
jgi:hypothetical protein